MPSATDETRILKFRFSMDVAPILVVALFLAVAWWIDGVERWLAMAVLALGPGLFGLPLFLEQRWISHWPQLAAVPFSRARFMISYYRSLPVGDRVWEVGWGVFGTILMFRYFDLEFWATLDPWDDWLAAILIVAGVGLLVFFVLRHTAVSLASLLPRTRRRPVEGSS
jgi:hypothetical protein